MSLKDSLYIPVFSDDTHMHVRLLPSSPIYAAHFPGYPITPGVILIQLATELLEEREGRHLELAEAVNVKFASPVFPGEGDVIVYSFAPDGDARWKVTVEKDGVLCAKMTLQYR